MMRKILIITLLFLLTLSGCAGELNDISDTLGTSVSTAEVLISEDSHGGFHGDGETYMVLQFHSEHDFSVPESACWHKLPLTENLESILYGRSAMLSDDDGEPRVPEITNGYYFFYDRHSESTDPADDGGILSRSSRNFTLAVYDADTYTLYFYELDT